MLGLKQQKPQTEDKIILQNVVLLFRSFCMPASHGPSRKICRIATCHLKRIATELLLTPNIRTPDVETQMRVAEHTGKCDTLLEIIKGNS